MDKCLFIGGSADGKIINVGHESDVYRHVRPYHFDCREVAELDRVDYVDIPCDVYRPLLFHVGYHKYVIYVLAGVSEAKMFDKLIASYAERSKANEVK